MANVSMERFTWSCCKMKILFFSLCSKVADFCTLWFEMGNWWRPTGKSWVTDGPCGLIADQKEEQRKLNSVPGLVCGCGCKAIIKNGPKKCKKKRSLHIYSLNISHLSHISHYITLNIVDSNLISYERAGHTILNDYVLQHLQHALTNRGQR